METEGVIPWGFRLAVVLRRVIFLPAIFLPILGWSWQEDGWQENEVARQVEWERSLFWGRLAVRELSDVKNAQPLSEPEKESKPVNRATHRGHPLRI